MGRLCAGDFVGVNDARTLRDPNCEGFDVGYSLVKRSVRFRISHSLIEQVSEVIKEGVLLLNL
jgi:hypothetical protein